MRHSGNYLLSALTYGHIQHYRRVIPRGQVNATGVAAEYVNRRILATAPRCLLTNVYRNVIGGGYYATAGHGSTMSARRELVGGGERRLRRLEYQGRLRPSASGGIIVWLRHIGRHIRSDTSARYHWRLAKTLLRYRTSRVRSH